VWVNQVNRSPGSQKLQLRPLDHPGSLLDDLICRDRLLGNQPANTCSLVNPICFAIASSSIRVGRSLGSVQLLKR
jgi:hypothetical protein